MLEELERLEVAYEVNPRLVRGLDYYIDTCFEFTLAMEATIQFYRFLL